MQRLINDFGIANLRGDFYGGLSAAVVALPLGLAFGVASGAGAIAGVYSAIIVGFFASVFGGTPAQISGPTGPMTVVMTAVVTTHVASDPETGLATAFGTVMLAGAFQIAFGLLRLGKYVVQVSYPVISGFMSGIGVIIILLQLHPLVGQPAIASPLEVIQQLPKLTSVVDWPTLGVGAMMVALLFAWRGRPNVLIPGPVLVLIAGSLLVFLVPAFRGISTLGEMPTGLPDIALPHITTGLLVQEVTSALLLAALGSIDSLLTSLVADNLTGRQHHSDKELVGQGVGNVLAGLFSALPGAGATVRTVVNVKSGGRTAWSGVFHAAMIAVVILAASDLAARIPHVVLAAILFKVGVDIIDSRFLRKIHRMPAVSGGLMMGVLLLTVFVDLITAVFVGVFIANMVTVERLTNLQLDNVSLVDHFEAVLREQRGITIDYEDVLLLELRGPMSFAVARGLNRRLAERGDHRTLVIDLSEAQLVGVTTSLVVLDIIEDEQSKGREVLLVGLDPATAAPAFERMGIFDKVEPPQRFERLEDLWGTREDQGTRA